MSNICVVTEELSGINKSGGIGACARGLVLHLISLGHHVTVLLTDLSLPEDFSPTDPELVGATLFSLNSVAARDPLIFKPNDAISKAYAVYRFFDNKRFAAVHFNEWCGSGFYVAMSRAQGNFPCPVITHLHGSSKWVRTYNKSNPELADFELEAIEHNQIENSDLIISPSNYLLQFYKDEGLNLPAHKQINWILPQWLSRQNNNLPLSTRSISPGQIQRIIFFGRHERRKGFEIFVEAIKRLPSLIQPDILFLGRFDKLDREFTGSYVFRKLPDYAGAIEFKNDLNQTQALQLIRRSTNSICVMPSLIENSPCTVGECFSIGTPFIATDTGGTSELIEQHSQEACLTAPLASSLADLLTHVIERGMPELKSTLVPAKIMQQWNQIHAEVLSKSQRIPVRQGEKPLVSVCFTHYERPNLLDKALKRIQCQTYENVEIIIVDDGSRQPSAIRYLDELESAKHRFPVKLIRQENKYLGAARNAAATAASGEFLLFHDDDNLAELNEVSSLIDAALFSGVDILTAQAYMFSESDEEGPIGPRRLLYFPIGIGGIFSFFRNIFGDANALFRRSTFFELGGFTELKGVGWEDWELFLKAYLTGAKMGIVPEPIFNYRVSSGGMLATSSPVANWERLYSMIAIKQPRMNSDIFRFANRQAVNQEIFERTWSILSRERHANLHQRLTDIDPNSSEARELLSDLAFEMGRNADAVELAMSNSRQRDKISALLAARLNANRIITKSIEAVRIPAKSNRDALYLRGWAVDNYGNPFNIKNIQVLGKWYNVVAISRYNRPDVANALGISNEKDLGFFLVAQPKSNYRFSWTSRSTISMPVNFESKACRIAGSHGSRVKGCIDVASWCSFQNITTPELEIWSGNIEVQTEQPADVAIITTAGDASFGKKINSTRTHFGSFDNERSLVQNEMRLVIPIGISCDLLFY